MEVRDRVVHHREPSSAQNDATWPCATPDDGGHIASATTSAFHVPPLDGSSSATGCRCQRTSIWQLDCAYDDRNQSATRPPNLAISFTSTSRSSDASPTAEGTAPSGDNRAPVTTPSPAAATPTSTTPSTTIPGSPTPKSWTTSAKRQLPPSGSEPAPSSPMPGAVTLSPPEGRGRRALEPFGGTTKGPSVVHDQRGEPPSAFGGQRCVGVGGVHAGGGASCDLKVWTRSVVHCSGISQGMKWPPWGWAAMLTWLYQAARSLARNDSMRSSGLLTPGGFS